MSSSDSSDSSEEDSVLGLGVGFVVVVVCFVERWERVRA